MTSAVSEQDIAAAVAALVDGQLVAFPTETVYGLGANARNAAAVARLYAAKGRPPDHPVIVHIASADDLSLWAREVPDSAAALAARFWPGPLTLVLPLRPDAGIASLVTAGLETIAIRVPRHRAMQALLAASGAPLAAPSANASNGLSPTRAEHVATSLGTKVPLIIDDGACAAGVESTIVAGRMILRPGPIAAADLPFPVTRRAEGTAITAPGQLATHYAPVKPLRLEATERRAGEWLIGYDSIIGDDTLSASGDLTEAAARLFDALHRADASDARGIAIAPIPHEGLGEAINDRLARAAHR